MFELTRALFASVPALERAHEAARAIDPGAVRRRPFRCILAPPATTALAGSCNDQRTRARGSPVAGVCRRSRVRDRADLLARTRATRAWQQSTREASDTRANEVAALLSVALERDMKGGQVSVLVPFNESLVNSPPLRTRRPVRARLRGFRTRLVLCLDRARRPSRGRPTCSVAPIASLVGTGSRRPRIRSGRLPAGPDALAPLVRRVRAAGRDGARFAFDETTIDDAPCPVGRADDV